MNRIFCLLVLLLAVGTSHGVTKSYVTKIKGISSDAQRFGGCMALLAKKPASVGMACKGSWVTFSCNGTFAAKDAANRNFEMAQIALLTGAQVRVWIDDTKKHNQICFVRRIDMYSK